MKIRITVMTLAVALTMVVAGSASAVVINVSTWAELKDAVDGDPVASADPGHADYPPPTAVDGDIVIVAAGLYATDGDRLDLYVPVTIRGVGDATIFDTTAVTNVEDVDNRLAVVRANCVFEDFKVINALSIDGGAFTDSSPATAMTFTNLTFVDCLSTGGSGGGVLRGKSALLSFEATNCRFINCDATGGRGGALSLDGEGDNGAVATITGCTFIDCDTSDDGGAIHKNNNGTLNLIDCTFTNNSCSDDGGAIKMDDDTGVLIVDGCTFDGNFTNNGGSDNNADGAHITIEDTGTLIVTNSIFLNGNAEDAGAINCDNDDNQKCHISNSLFVNNVSSDDGPLKIRGGDIKLVNNTLVSNVAGDVAEGIVRIDDGVVPFTSIIISNNIFQSNSGSDEIVKFDDQTPATAALTTITNNCFFGNTLANGTVLVDGSDADGLAIFTETGRVTADPVLSFGTYQPTRNSTAIIDAADATQAPADDIRGLPRGAAPDIGAYEYFVPSGESGEPNPGMPVASAVGLGLLGCAIALGGASFARKRK